MAIKQITSLQHPTVLSWVDLRRERSARETRQEVLISGDTLISELSQKYPIKSLITISSPPHFQAKETFIVTKEILKKITSLQSPPDSVAIFELPPPQEIKNPKRVLILDRLQDPGNLGTLIRTAYAFGWDGVIAIEGSVDFFNDKALRASRGAIFHLPYSWYTTKECIGWSQKRGVSLFLADLEGDQLSDIEIRSPCGLILSNEGKGAFAWAEQIGHKITIPMKQGESLNVSAAGAILLYAMRGL